jgi:hypothetical protein
MIRRTLLATAALGLLAAAPAPADSSIDLIVGPANNLCQVQLKKIHEAPGMGGVDKTEFSGITSCQFPVQQTAHSYVPAGSGDPGPLDGGTCSGFRARCETGGSQWDQGNYDLPMVYDITLTSPSEDPWTVAPAECSGVNTTRLTCRFTLDDSLWF